MLYTAQAYMDRITNEQTRKDAKKQLAPLIRCPQLSLYWLSASVHSPDRRNLLLHSSSNFKKQLKQLLLLRHANPAQQLAAGEVAAGLPNAPASWFLQRRELKQRNGGVGVQWSLDIATLKAAAKRSADEKINVELQPKKVTPPLGGVAFSICMRAAWDAAANGSRLDILAVPKNVPSGTFYRASYELWCGASNGPVSTYHCLLNGNSTGGGEDCFNVGTMSGGWDGAAWAAEGLPTSGELVLNLRITLVNGCSYLLVGNPIRVEVWGWGLGACYHLWHCRACGRQ